MKETHEKNRNEARTHVSLKDERPNATRTTKTEKTARTKSKPSPPASETRKQRTRHPDSLLSTLETSLGHRFSNQALLERALTHRSSVHEHRHGSREHNERLEFLGDAALELVITHLLMETHPHSSEGDLSKLRAALVNQKSLAKRAERIDLGNYLRLGKGEEHGDGRHKASLLSDTYEAVLGAVYLDGGYQKTFRVVEAQFRDLLKEANAIDFVKDYKTQLQERVQTLFHTVPRYVLKSASGPDHDKYFEIDLLIGDKTVASGKGKNKKSAEQSAAEEALAKLSTPTSLT